MIICPYCTELHQAPGRPCQSCGLQLPGMEAAVPAAGHVTYERHAVKAGITAGEEVSFENPEHEAT